MKEEISTSLQSPLVFFLSWLKDNGHPLYPQTAKTLSSSSEGSERLRINGKARHRSLTHILTLLLKDVCQKALLNVHETSV